MTDEDDFLEREPYPLPQKQWIIRSLTGWFFGAAFGAVIAVKGGTPAIVLMSIVGAFIGAAVFANWWDIMKGE